MISSLSAEPDRIGLRFSVSRSSDDPEGPRELTVFEEVDGELHSTSVLLSPSDVELLVRMLRRDRSGEIEGPVYPITIDEFSPEPR